MKKIIKNILLTFIIIYTVLNLVLYIYSVISKYYTINKILTTEYIEENISLDATQIHLELLRSYIRGISTIIESQTILLILTAVLSIAIGIIISLTEKPKVKEILDFIIAGVILVLACAIIRCIGGEYKEFEIFDEIIDIINSFGIYYIVAYVGKIIYTYFKNKKSVKELNKELKNKF